jgi:hypothetical protein
LCHLNECHDTALKEMPLNARENLDAHRAAEQMNYMKLKSQIERQT